MKGTLDRLYSNDTTDPLVFPGHLEGHYTSGLLTHAVLPLSVCLYCMQYPLRSADDTTLVNALPSSA